MSRSAFRDGAVLGHVVDAVGAVRTVHEQHRWLIVHFIHPAEALAVVDRGRQHDSHVSQAVAVGSAVVHLVHLLQAIHDPLVEVALGRIAGVGSLLVVLERVVGAIDLGAQLVELRGGAQDGRHLAGLFVQHDGRGFGEAVLLHELLHRVFVLVKAHLVEIDGLVGHLVPHRTKLVGEVLAVIATLLVHIHGRVFFAVDILLDPLLKLIGLNVQNSCRHLDSW